MKVLYLLALVVVAYAAPIDTPPQNVKASVHQEEGKIFFVVNWDKVESGGDDPILGYKVKVFEGKLYVNYETKEDGSKVTEVVVPRAPEKPITEVAEFEVPADKNEYIYNDMKKGVLYQVAVQAYTAKGAGPLSEKAGFPLNTPPENVKATTYLSDDETDLYFVLKWDKVESPEASDPVIGYKIKVYEGKIETTSRMKEDGSIVQEAKVDLENYPKEPTVEVAEIDVPADKNECIYHGMKERVLYEVGVQAYTAKGRGPESQRAKFTWL